MYALFPIIMFSLLSAPTATISSHTQLDGNFTVAADADRMFYYPGNPGNVTVTFRNNGPENLTFAIRRIDYRFDWDVSKTLRQPYNVTLGSTQRHNFSFTLPSDLLGASHELYFFLLFDMVNASTGRKIRSDLEFDQTVEIRVDPTYRTVRLNITDSLALRIIKNVSVDVWGPWTVRGWEWRNFTLSDGVLRIEDRLDADHEIIVWYDSPYTGRREEVAHERGTLLTRAQQKIIKTSISDIEIIVLEGDGDKVKTDVWLGFKKVRGTYNETSMGYIFVGVQHGRHNLLVMWKGASVLDEALQIGERRVYTVTAPIYDMTVGFLDLFGERVGTVKVTIEGPSKETTLSLTVTDSFALTQMPLGTYRILVMSIPTLSAEETVVGEHEISHISGKTYSLRIKIGTIRFEYNDALGKPLSDVSMNLSRDSLSVSTDRGEVSRLTVADYKLTATYKGVKVLETTLTIDLKQEKYTFLLPVHTGSLLFVDYSGNNTLPNVKVTLRGPNDKTSLMTTSLTSRVELPLLPQANYNVTVEWRGSFVLKRVLALTDLLAQPVLRCNVFMPVLTILDEKAEPVVRAKVRIGDFEAFTDDAGVVRLPLTPGGRHPIALVSESVEILRDFVSFDTDNQRVTLQVPLYDAVVNVRNLFGSPISKALVQVFSEDHLVREGRTDAGGKVTLKQIPAIKYRLFVNYLGYEHFSAVDIDKILIGEPVVVSLPVVLEIAGTTLTIEIILIIVLAITAVFAVFVILPKVRGRQQVRKRPLIRPPGI